MSALTNSRALSSRCSARVAFSHLHPACEHELRDGSWYVPADDWSHASLHHLRGVCTRASRQMRGYEAVSADRQNASVVAVTYLMPTIPRLHTSTRALVASLCLPFPLPSNLSLTCTAPSTAPHSGSSGSPRQAAQAQTETCCETPASLHACVRCHAGLASTRMNAVW